MSKLPTRNQSLKKAHQNTHSHFILLISLVGLVIIVFISMSGFWKQNIVKSDKLIHPIFPTPTENSLLYRLIPPGATAVLATFDEKRTAYMYEGHSKYAPYGAFSILYPDSCTLEVPTVSDQPRKITCTTPAYSYIIYPEAENQNSVNVGTNTVQIGSNQWVRKKLSNNGLISTVYSTTGSGATYVISISFTSYSTDAEKDAQRIIATFQPAS